MKIGTSTVTAIYLGTTSIVSAYLGSTQVFGGASAFTPLDLFSTGSQGIWLDPSDLTTMFSDRAGTTPVTTPGTVVGLRLDKSKGLTLGAELVTNGTFDSGTTGWTSWQTGTLSVDTGRLKVENGAATISGGYQLITVVVGKVYQFEGIKEAGTASGPRYYLGTSVGGTQYSSNAAASTKFTATSTTLVVTASTQTTTLGATAFFDNISVRELAGNHATAPTDAARPIYGVEPKGGRRNLLTYSEDLTNVIWAKANVTANAAGLITATGAATQVTQVQVVTAATAYTLSAKFKAGTSSFATIRMLNYDTANQAWFNVSTGVVGGFTGFASTEISGPDADGFYRCSAKGFTTTTDVSGSVALGMSDANNSLTSTVGRTIYAKEVQLELGSTATAYQRVTTAYDVTESGVATTHYVQYDGSDDSMSTAAIDFTGTDRMSVFAGVRKLSDAATGMVAETGSGGVNGTFALEAPNSVIPASYRWTPRGTASASVSVTGFAAPISTVLTGLDDISGDTSTLRVNGTQVAQSTADQGTSNFGNLPLFIGRRNNATLPFNGRDYGIIIVGKAASAGEITDTETWLAARTAQVTL